ILAADVVGFSRMMGADEAGTLAALKTVRAEVVDGKIAEHDGRIVKLTGDGVLVEFSSVVSAVGCAVAVQRAMQDRNAGLPPDRRLQFRIGVNLGDVIVEGDDIYGDGVNVAARLESVATPGGIAVSHTVREHVGNRLDLTFEDRGEQQLKNIEKPMRVYDVLLGETKNIRMPLTKSDKPSIAVLPFTNMSGDPEQEYFSDGITEDIITDLSKISGLSVIARNTSFTYKGRAVKVQNVGQELGVEFMLEGSVRKAGPRVRVTAQLITSSDGTHIWAERFDRDLTDIFAIQDEITHAIVEQLKVKLLPLERKSLGQSPTDNVEAYTYYLRGRDFFYRHSKRYFELARRMFAKAVELDPNYARAYAGMAECEAWLYLTYQVSLSIEGILELANKALALDNNLAEAHASRGAALTAASRFAEANEEYERALALDRNSFEAHVLYARSSMLEGELERAARLLECAAEILPENYQPPCTLIQVYRSLGLQEKSREAARKAIPLAERELTLHPEDPRPAHFGVSALIEAGEHERAREWISRALAIDPDDINTLYNCACGYAKLGESEAALDLLEQVVQRGAAGYRSWMVHDSDMDPLRSHPRFQQLLERFG
ncbi:MAG: adenylate/guanylate cyclase domain-containing protein, partial [Chthoniobacterales bacterium]|nr:adenylate/guanylate cyclase domain-containing protein [Chthoniobacterales bacterium]